MDSPSQLPERLFPPLYKSSGSASSDRLAFFHVLERLKIQNPESISDHMYRMAILAMSSDEKDLDISKCVMMCLVHDLPEAHVGDIAPTENIRKEHKHRLEEDAMHNFVHVMLHDIPAAQRVGALWNEYEEGQTKEARFVKDLDRFEMALQAFEYERRDGVMLQEFFGSSLPKIQHPVVQGWARELAAERELFFASAPDLEQIDE